MRSPFDLNTHRSVVLDPKVPLGFPQRPSDEDYDRVFRERVRANELRRLRAECEKLVFLREQAAL